MLNFDEMEYVIGIWFVGNNDVGDWLACLYRVKGETELTLTHRFRYYEDDRAFDSNDRTNWYEGKVPATSEVQTIKAIGIVAKEANKSFPGLIDCVMVRGSAVEAIEKIKKRPWAHIREAWLLAEQAPWEKKE